MQVQTSLTEKELKAYSTAGAVAEEVLSAIKTVFAFSGQQKELERYKKSLTPAENNGIKKGTYTGLGGGTMWFIIDVLQALAFWYGMRLILEDRDKEIKEYTPATLLIVLFGVLTGAQNLGMTLPHLEAFNVARASAAEIFEVIEQESKIDPMSAVGDKLSSICGNIEFKEVHFSYPTRPSVKALKGISFQIKAGTSVALVGPSGCGKSTCLQLIQRFYDPTSGSVMIDGKCVDQLNVASLRSFIGLVGQEPVLFDTTISENIRFGNLTASQADIEQAARMANCHQFIAKLPLAYETRVGQRGTQLSGGQKQRIAIARALVGDPSILLLDEATSALDGTSEKQVQEALEKASKGRTTVIISHRLSSIVDADRIIYIDEGQVIEEGSHAELMALKGHYYQLVLAQTDRDRHHQKIEELGLVKHNDLPNADFQFIEEDNNEFVSTEVLSKGKQIISTEKNFQIRYLICTL